MAFKTANLVLVANAAQPVLVKGSGTGQFKNIVGTVTDPIPISILNTSATAVLIGGPNVGTAGDPGYPLQQNVPFQMNVYGESEIPWLLSTGTPTVNVLCGRQ